VQISENSMR